MSLIKEDLKNKIIYRASYRGTKEMDILMTKFIKSIIDKLSFDELKALDTFINMDDQDLISIKKKEKQIKYENSLINKLIKEFQKF